MAVIDIKVETMEYNQQKNGRKFIKYTGICFYCVLVIDKTRILLT